MELGGAGWSWVDVDVAGWRWVHGLVMPQKNYLHNYITKITYIVHKKDPILKKEFRVNYKKCKDLILTLMKKIKQLYYDKYFGTNWNNTMEKNQIPYFCESCSFQCINFTLP